ncbi:MAG: RNA polymerase factor sigma-54 [Eubacterium sp.]|jgi:RNA polymerase sigma-54 factor
MKIGYEFSIEQKQTQTLSMTPELIQAIKILQFNTMELNDYVKEELLENPVLEDVRDPEDELSSDIDVDALRDSILESDSKINSYREYDPNDDEPQENPGAYVAFRTSLTEHLLMQLHFSELEGHDADIGRYIVEAIDRNGYLSIPLDEVASAVSATKDDVERVLEVIQTFDPTGVGARDLSECLLIQLEQEGSVPEDISYFVKHELENLAANKISKIGREMGISTARVLEIAKRIRGLEPKPGRLYDADQTIKYIIPDITVDEIDGRYKVLMNDGGIPHLIVSSYYERLRNEAASNSELAKYLNDRFNSALWLMKSIERRKNTICRVASAIVDYQQDFFRKGELYLKPLTLKQIADVVNVHESTVSRSINGKYLQCARGVLELKYFFSSGVYSDDGEGVSSSSVKMMIKDIISGENPKKPYSDQAIAAMLTRRGIEISRRTVAKYREEAGIRSSTGRKKF